MNPSVDVAVVGAGAAGLAAAIAAARAGCSTLLMDRRPAAGGTGGFSGLTTLCGLFDDEGRWLVEGLAREFAEAIAEGAPVRMGRVWAQLYQPEKFRETAAKFISTTPGLQTLWNTPLAEVRHHDRRITALCGREVRAVIDCSGEAEVARAIGIECPATDEATQAPAVIFPLHNIGCPLESAADRARVLLPLARAGLPPLRFQPGAEPGTVTVKLAGRPEQAREVLEFLRANVRGFERCATPQAEMSASRRAGRMIPGEYVLTGADVLAGRKFPDAAARCAWPVEQWGPDGACRLRYLAAGAHYEIPARSLRAAGAGNLFMAGKTISADAEAIASARVMGACLATGMAAGQLAAAHLKSDSTR
jgi:hypothetical protein